MSTALATWINGPVLRARPDGPFRLREAVTVGEQRLLGEVIRPSQAGPATAGTLPNLRLLR